MGRACHDLRTMLEMLFALHARRAGQHTARPHTAITRTSPREASKIIIFIQLFPAQQQKFQLCTELILNDIGGARFGVEVPPTAGNHFVKPVFTTVRDMQ